MNIHEHKPPAMNPGRLKTSTMNIDEPNDEPRASVKVQMNQMMNTMMNPGRL